MSLQTFRTLVVLAALLVPLAVHLYLHGLPHAPTCPTCRATTRELRERLVLRWLSPAVSTSRAECTRCGWRGRMRWRFAARAVPRSPY